MRDEVAWAATELYVTTKEAQYYQASHLLAAAPTLPTWSQVRGLGYYTLLRFGQALPAAQQALPQLRQRLLGLADSLVAVSSTHAYGTAMGAARDYSWGSNANAANQGIALVQAYRLTHKAQYLRTALANLDYLLGRNATGYCFVTGSGTHSPQHPHHRLSEADAVAAPVPGLLVGGPNPGRQDGCPYPSALAPLAYTDTVCAYASNEVAINWNAPLAYLATALEALQKQAGFSPAAK